MSSPTVGYAVLPIVPSLKGLDAEIRKQLGPGLAKASAQAAAATGAMFRESFDKGADAASLGLSAGDDYSTAFASSIAAGGAASAVSKSFDAAKGTAGAAGKSAGSEFSAAINTQLASLPKAQADRLADQLRSQAAAQKAAGEAASRSWVTGFKSGLQRSRSDLADIGIDASSLTSFGLKAVAVGGVVAFGLGKATKATGDLNAAVSSSEQVFGEAAGGIESWSKGSANAFGLSQRAAIEAATSFGAFGKQAGLQGPQLADFSTGLTELAADLAAFKNTTPADALAALQSGLAGETEPLRRYQILLSDAQLRQEAFKQGLIDSVSEGLTPQNRVLAAQSLIFAQASDKVGQFTREQGELSAQQAILTANWEDAQAALGQSLLPTLTDGAKGLNNLLQGFQGLDDGTQSLVAKLLAGGAAATVIVGGLSLAAGAGLKIADAYGRITASGEAGNRVMARTGTVAKGLGTALGAAGAVGGVLLLTDALYGLTQSSESVEATLNRLKLVVDSASLEDAFAALNAYSEERLSLIDRLRQPVGGEDDIFGLSGEVVSNLTRVETVLENLYKNRDTKTLQSTIDLLRDAANLEINAGTRDELLALVDSYTRALGESKAVQDGATEGADDQADATERLAKAQETLDAATSKLTARQQLLTLSFDANATAAQSYMDSIERSSSADNLLRAGLGVAGALRSMREGLFGQADAAAESKTQTDLLQEALDGLQDALKWTNPELSAGAIEMGRYSAAAEGFRRSMENTNRLGSQVESALGLGRAYKDFSKVAKRLPADLNIVDLTLGKLKRSQMDAVESALALGESTRDYLATLLETGAGADKVRSEANRIRDAFIAQLRAVGLTEEQIQKYLETLGLTPSQVETAIKVSGVDAARFEIDTLLQLLDGRIPEAVAKSVAALISSGDLEGAARQLRQLAATNPIKIPLGVDAEQAKQDLIEIPQQFDFAKAALGGYTEAQEKGLDAVLKLGDATKTYLGEIIGSGNPERARTEADNLREAYRQQFEQLGITGPAFESYLELLGLTPDQVNTAITVSEFDKTVFEITTVLSLLQGLGDLDPEVALRISDAILNEDYPAVRAILEQQVDAQLGLDDGAARSGLDVYRDYVSTHPATAVVDADTNPGRAAAWNFARDVGLLRPTITVDVLPRYDNGLIRLLPGLPGPNLGAFGVPIANRGGADGNPATPFRQGGIITGPTFAKMGEDYLPEVILPLTNPNRAAQLFEESGLAAVLAKADKKPPSLSGVDPFVGTRTDLSAGGAQAREMPPIDLHAHYHTVERAPQPEDHLRVATSTLWRAGYR